MIPGDARYPQPVAPAVTLHLKKERAVELSEGLASLLCWHRGYAAAKGPDAENMPIGVEELRELRIALNRAINQ